MANQSGGMESSLMQNRRRKVKSGCLTCKKRRVKCDEARPVCERCLSTGRVCDGYGIWGGGGNTYAQRTALTPTKTSSTNNSQNGCSLADSNQQWRTVGPLLLAISALPDLAAHPAKQAAFDFFRAYTVVKLPGVFESGFWDDLVLRAMASEPAVLHAVVALGAAHREDEPLALAEYNTAIEHLQRHLVPRSGQPDTSRPGNLRRKKQCPSGSDRDDSLRVVLITCMLFICVEMLRGDYARGTAHLHNGLRLLREMQARQGLTPARDGPVLLRPLAVATAAAASSPRRPSAPRAKTSPVEDQLVEVFTRFNAQSSLFGYGSPYLYHVGETAFGGPTYAIPQAFTSFGSARQHLDGLMNGVYALSQQANRLVHASQPLPSDLTPRRNALQLGLRRWLAAFDASSASLAEYANPRSLLGVPLLRMFHDMTAIMAATSLRGTDEMAFDSHGATFASILRQAVELWRLCERIFALPFPACVPRVPSVGFTTDMGFIPPVYYAAVKCRVPAVRRLAHGLLVSAPHVEGVWHGHLVARIAKVVMEVEEGDSYDGVEFPASGAESGGGRRGGTHVGGADDGGVGALPVVPGHRRIHEVRVDLPQARGDTKATLHLARHVGGGQGEEAWEFTSMEFDMSVAHSTWAWECRF